MTTVTTETLPAIAPLEPTTPIKPSEAIRLGCLIAPRQIAGAFYGPDGRACAMGAARLGWGGSEGPDSFQTYKHLIRFDSNQLACPACPEGAFGPFDAGWTISHLNDGHLWTRERIADWLAGLGL